MAGHSVHAQLRNQIFKCTKKLKSNDFVMKIVEIRYCYVKNEVLLLKHNLDQRDFIKKLKKR